MLKNWLKAPSAGEIKHFLCSRVKAVFTRLRRQNSSGGEPDEPCSLDEVRRRELEYINAYRKRQSRSEIRDISGSTCDLTGLALSGGGIRSAAFQLGVLQGLAERRCLRNVDYVSAVSGGGYIAAWFVTLVKHHTLDWFERRLGEPCTRPAGAAEPAALAYLRDYSNYLTPRIGAFSPHTWTFVADYVQNLLRLVCLTTCLFVGVLLLPRFLLGLVKWYACAEPRDAVIASVVAMVAFLSLVLLSVVQSQTQSPRSARDNGILASRFGLAVMLLAYALTGVGIRLGPQLSIPGSDIPFRLAAKVAQQHRWVGTAAVCVMVLLIPLFFQRVLSKVPLRGRQLRIGRIVLGLLVLVFSAVVWGPSALWFLNWSAPILSVIKVTESGRIITDQAAFVHAAVFGSSCMLVLLFISLAVLDSALNHVKDTLTRWLRIKNVQLVRERASRLYGSLLFFAVLWSSLCAVAVYGPLLMFLPRASGGAAAVWGAWVVACAVGFLLVRNARRSTAILPDAQTWYIRLMPHFFLGGVALLYTWVVFRVLFGFTWKRLDLFWYDTVSSFDWQTTAQYLALTALLGHIAASFTGVNRYSMHMFYRRRLAECFLGAWRLDDDAADADAQENDYPLSDACKEDTPEAPYLLLNASLNLSSRSRLAWQERRTAPFLFSSLFCGFEIEILNYQTERYQPISAYRRTSVYKSGGKDITLALAMATSGAAVTPLMTSRGTPRLSLIATLLNLRLGWWIANPYHELSARVEVPRSRVHLLVRELVGQMTHDDAFVYLSDGGHFDNLGLYELVRRRCRLIIVSDASEDPQQHLKSLGEAVERCRVDLGVEIELDAGTKEWSERGTPFWKGRVYYGDKGDASTTGEIFYFKPAVTSRPPADVLSYSWRRRGFPHESTVNQWFGESQFESYRRLGVEFGRLAADRLAPAPFGASAGH